MDGSVCLIPTYIRYNSRSTYHGSAKVRGLHGVSPVRARGVGPGRADRLSLVEGIEEDLHSPPHPLASLRDEVKVPLESKVAQNQRHGTARRGL